MGDPVQALRRRSLAESKRYSSSIPITKTLKEIYFSACKDFGVKPSQELLRRWGGLISGQNDVTHVELGGVLNLGSNGLICALRAVREGLTLVEDISFRDANIDSTLLTVLCQNLRLMSQVRSIDFSDNPSISSGAPVVSLVQLSTCRVERVVLDGTYVPKGQRLVIEHRTSRNRRVVRKPQAYFPPDIVDKVLHAAPRDMYGLYLEDPTPGLTRFAQRKGWKLSLTGRGAADYEVTPFLDDTEGDDVLDYLELRGRTPLLFPDVDEPLPTSLDAQFGITRALLQYYAQTVGCIAPDSLRSLLNPNTFAPAGFYTVRLYVGGDVRYLLVDDDVASAVSPSLPSIHPLPVFTGRGADDECFGSSPFFHREVDPDEASDAGEGVAAAAAVDAPAPNIRDSARGGGLKARMLRGGAPAEAFAPADAAATNAEGAAAALMPAGKQRRRMSTTSSCASQADHPEEDDLDADDIPLNPFFDEACATGSLARSILWKTFVLLKRGAGLDAVSVYSWFTGNECVNYALDAAGYHAVWDTLNVLSGTLPPKQVVGFARAKSDASDGITPYHLYRIRKVLRNQHGKFLIIRNKYSEGTQRAPSKIAWTGMWGEGSYEQGAYEGIYRKLWIEPEEGDVLIRYRDFYKNFAACGVSFEPPAAPRRHETRGRWSAENGYEQIWRVVIADTSTASVVLMLLLPPHHPAQMMSLTVFKGEGEDPVPPPPHIDVAGCYAASGIIDSTVLPLRVDLPRGVHFVVVRMHPPPVFFAEQTALNALNNTAPSRAPSHVAAASDLGDTAATVPAAAARRGRPATSPLRVEAAADQLPRPATAISFAAGTSFNASTDRPATTGLHTAYSDAPGTRGVSPVTATDIALTALSGTFQDRPGTTTSATASEKFSHRGDDVLAGFDMSATLPQYDASVGSGADATHGVGYRLLGYLSTSGVTQEDGCISFERIPADRGWRAASARARFTRSSELEIQADGTPPPFGLTLGAGTMATGVLGTPFAVAIMLELETDEHVDYQLTFKVCIGSERIIGFTVDDRVVAPSRPSSVAKAPSKTPTLEMLLPPGQYTIVPHVYPAGIAGRVKCNVWARDVLDVKPVRPLSVQRQTTHFRRAAAARMKLMVRIPLVLLASRPSTRASTATGSEKHCATPGCKEMLLTLTSKSASVIQFTVTKMSGGRAVPVAASPSLPFETSVLLDPPVGGGAQADDHNPEVELCITPQQLPAGPRDACTLTVCYDPNYYVHRDQVELTVYEQELLED